MSEQEEKAPNEESAAESSGISPGVAVGRRLAQAREAKGMQRDAVARELRLHEKLIAALEEGREDELPPVTFVSGYLRNYARLLGLDGDALVNDYRQGSEAPPPLTPNSAVAEVRSSDAMVKMITYFIVLVLSLLLVLWWMSRQPDEASTQVEAPEVESLAAGDSLELSLPPVEADEADEPVVDEAPEPEAEPEVEEPAPEPEPEPEPQAEAAQPDLAQIQVLIEKDSWVEIHDSDGERLAYGLYKTGRELSEQGRAPFKLFFGYAPGAKVWLNGESVDVMSYKRSGNDTARFQLGSAEDN